MSTIQVAVVGAGIAGLTAAFRLLERGYEVTVYDDKTYIGGKFGGHTHSRAEFGRRAYLGGKAYRPHTYHEHCYHMFMNWYHNFWRLTEDAGIDRGRFEARESVLHLGRHEYPHMRAFNNPGSPETGWTNLFSGIRSVPDMFLYSFSVLDLLLQNFDDPGLLSRHTVNSFMQSRPYATAGSATLHEDTLVKAFACPSYLTSARSYQAYTKYSFCDPVPMFWVLKGDCATTFNAPLKAKLDAMGCRWRLGEMVTRVRYDKGARRIRLDSTATRDADLPHVSPASAAVEPDGAAETVSYDYVVIAVPPPALRAFFAADEDFASYFIGPNTGVVEKLHTEPIASVDLYLDKRIPGMPRNHVVLLGSKYGLTFIDNSQLWPGVEYTSLNVIVTEFDALAELPESMAFSYIMRELSEYLPITEGDVAYWHIQTNVGDELFLNEVGSHQWRPNARTAIPNLFLAGDYCRTFIDIVTIEGAVVSGLEAASAVLERAAHDFAGQIAGRENLLRPIEIIEPDTHPAWLILGLQLLYAPYVPAAKLWSWMLEQAGFPTTDDAPRGASPDLVTMASKLVTAPLTLGFEWWRSVYSAYAGLARRSGT